MANLLLFSHNHVLPDSNADNPGGVENPDHPE
jgi:hypothetical protein